MNNLTNFPCKICTHLKMFHLKDYWGSPNRYHACSDCYKDGWGGSKGIHPVHGFEADNLKYVEQLYDGSITC